MTIDIAEWQTWTGTLPADTARAMATTKLVQASSTLDGQTVLRSDSWVGVTRHAGTRLSVRPKIGVRRLLWMLAYDSDPEGWRDEEVALEEDADVVTAAAVAFAHYARRALAGGVLQDYVTVEDSSMVLRGRLREADQLRRRMGLPLPVEVRYDDYTVDIAENRLLLSAALRLLRLPSLPIATVRILRHLVGLLLDVTPLLRGGQLPEVRWTRRNSRYRPAVALARLILRGTSFDSAEGGVSATAFAFDMNVVYERFVTTALATALQPFGGSLHAQRQSRLDDAGDIFIRPDMVWRRGGVDAAVLDAKYKDLSARGVRVEDAYQALAYCTALNLPGAHLVYSSKQPSHTVHRVRGSEKRIVVWSLDLTAPREQLLLQVSRLAASLRLEAAGALVAAV